MHTGASIADGRDRCIGCGLCVTACPAEAVSLIRKPAERNGQEYLG
ncbi:MAG: 4Fe-4S binding protein [bacterium]